MSLTLAWSIGSGSTAADRGRDARRGARLPAAAARASSVLVDRRFDRSALRGAAQGRAVPRGPARRRARRPRPPATCSREALGDPGARAVLLASRREQSTSTPDGRVVELTRRPATGAHAGPARRRCSWQRSSTISALGERPDLLDERHRRGRAGDRDRAPARRGAPAAGRGRGFARADRHRRLRGAPAARARPPRRRPAAARLDRPRAAPRPEPAARAERRSAISSTRPSTSWPTRSRSCASSPAASGPAGLDDGLAAGAARARVALAAADPRRGDRRALRRPARDRRLLRRQRGAGQRGQARRAPPRSRSARRGATAGS